MYNGSKHNAVGMLIEQPTLAVERKEERERRATRGYIVDLLYITGLTITHELWQRHQTRTEHTR